jgi:hypothetical protein
MNHDFSDAAIDALIAASLRQGYSSDEPSEASIAAAINVAAIEAPEDTARLERIRARLATSISQTHSTGEVPRRKTISGQLMAMNRNHDEATFSEPTQNALDEARRKAIEELQNDQDQQQQGGDCDDNT